MSLKKLFLLGLLTFSCSLPVQAMKRKRATTQTTKKKQPTSRKKLYDPSSTEPFKISRSKLSLFLKCPRCFYLDCKFGLRQPPGYPFTLNNAVDTLLKNEFDIYRKSQEPHPLLIKNGINAIPFNHPDINKWRDSLHHGIQYLVPGTNILFYGGIDDVWINPQTEELMIADYKATSKAGTVNLDAPWQIDYKRQVEIYQWLFRKNEFKVSDTAYFVYCNGIKNVDRFDNHLDFETLLLPYEGDASWIDDAIIAAYNCLQSNALPPVNNECAYCKYVKSVFDTLLEIKRSK